MSQPGAYGRELPLDVQADLRAMNPHWRGDPLPEVRGFRRWVFPKLLDRLLHGLTPGVVLRGPRRVGKSVLVDQVREHLLGSGVDARRILFVAFDDLPRWRSLEQPILEIARWFEDAVFRDTFNAGGNRGEPAILLFDEVQNLDDWAIQVKHLVDMHPVRVLITGSSSLRIDAGKDSIAGRVMTLTLGPLLLREIAAITTGAAPPPYWVDNGMGELAQAEFWRGAARFGREHAAARDAAFQLFSERGGYPVGYQERGATWSELGGYLNETVVERALQHDLRLGRRGRKRDAVLLGHVFRLACRYAGQAPGLHTMAAEIRALHDGSVGEQRVANYLRLIDGMLLLRLVEPLELRLKKQRAAPRICLCDHALRASWLQERVPLEPAALAAAPHLADLAGHIAESVVGYFFAGIPNLELSWFPERSGEPEVDFVLTVGDRRVPVEVKYRRRIEPRRDTRGLTSFLDKSVYNAPVGLLVTLEDDVTVDDPRIVPISLASLLWAR